ncbi:MAG: hypothetical protein CFH40_00710 [Alphaproteobacteria bacterium MarineAlpha10_Bin3]|nr:MAG: hypothetical protein CFH40_00710 [Alphaproteobacteria bacterium MarineAlpha10_Bin3]PPR73725.1 MAG: hypothetical protein CFH09_00710 [Alphaproteobacteria bacterium MarineAlpha4_Bin1]
MTITSDLTLIAGAPPADVFTLPDAPGIGVVIGAADGEKCERCWRVRTDIGAALPGICGRCADVVQMMRAAAQ